MSVDRGAALALLVTLVVALPARGQEAPMVVSPAGVQLRPAASPAMRFVSRLAVEPLARLAPAIEDAGAELESTAAWNEAGGSPQRNGFLRPLPDSRRVGFSAALAERVQSRETLPHDGGLLYRGDGAGLSWSAEVTVEGARRLRLHLAGVTLPQGTLLWVYGEGSEVVGPVGLELSTPERDLWTPSVGGGSIRIELLLPTDELEALGEASIVIDGVLEIFELDSRGAPLLTGHLQGRGTECLVDAQCNGVIQPADPQTLDLFQQAIASLSYVKDGLSFICTGGLLNDMDNTSLIPYLLTANHCIDSQQVASTLEASWDYYTATCGGDFPDPGGLPRSNGATLLATTSGQDSTLLRLFSVPPNRVLFGWNGNPGAVPNDTVVHRVSHPMGWPQAFSSSHIDTSTPACQGTARPDFLHSRYDRALGDLGSTAGGSSGAPLLLPNGQVVGQLGGNCGPAPEEVCDTRNRNYDGAFSQYFGLYAPFLTAVAQDTCVRSATTHCFGNGRFRVEMSNWRFPNGKSGMGQVVPDFFNDNSGIFYFDNSGDWQMQIKILNGCALNNHFWVFYAATTNVEFALTVTDTQTGMSKSYSNPLNNPAPPIQDTAAFATCP